MSIKKLSIKILTISALAISFLIIPIHDVSAGYTISTSKKGGCYTLTCKCGGGSCYCSDINKKGKCTEISRDCYSPCSSPMLQICRPSPVFYQWDPVPGAECYKVRSSWDLESLLLSWDDWPGGITTTTDPWANIIEMEAGNFWQVWPFSDSTCDTPLIPEDEVPINIKGEEQLPILVEPVDIEWTPVTGADHYNLVLARGSPDTLNSTRPYFAENITDTQYTVEVNWPGRYFWGIYAFDNAGNLLNPTPVYASGTTYNPFSCGIGHLDSPWPGQLRCCRSGSVEDCLPYIQWDSIYGAKRYDIMVENIADSTDVHSYTNIRGDTKVWTPPPLGTGTWGQVLGFTPPVEEAPADDLEIGETYRWAVKGRDEDGHIIYLPSRAGSFVAKKIPIDFVPVTFVWDEYDPSAGYTLKDYEIEIVERVEDFNNFPLSPNEPPPLPPIEGLPGGYTPIRDGVEEGGNGGPVIMDDKNDKKNSLFGSLFSGFAKAARAQGGDPPVVTTEPASNITETEATLNATIIPNAADAFIMFELDFEGDGIMEGGIIQEACTQYGLSGTSQISITCGIGGLIPNTSYNFRALAGNLNTLTPIKGNWRTFVATLPPEEEEEGDPRFLNPPLLLYKQTGINTNVPPPSEQAAVAFADFLESWRLNLADIKLRTDPDVHAFFLEQCYEEPPGDYCYEDGIYGHMENEFDIALNNMSTSEAVDIFYPLFKNKYGGDISVSGKTVTMTGSLSDEVGSLTLTDRSLGGASIVINQEDQNQDGEIDLTTLTFNGDGVFALDIAPFGRLYMEAPSRGNQMMHTVELIPGGRYYARIRAVLYDPDGNLVYTQWGPQPPEEPGYWTLDVEYPDPTVSLFDLPPFAWISQLPPTSEEELLDKIEEEESAITSFGEAVSGVVNSFRVGIIRLFRGEEVAKQKAEELEEAEKDRTIKRYIKRKSSGINRGKF